MHEKAIKSYFFFATFLFLIRKKEMLQKRKKEMLQKRSMIL